MDGGVVERLIFQDIASPGLLCEGRSAEPRTSAQGRFCASSSAGGAAVGASHFSSMCLCIHVFEDLL